MATHDQADINTRQYWHLDPPHTLVEFSARHMMITTVKGHFRSVRGTIYYDEADPSRSWVEAEIDAASLYTGTEMRDNDLRSDHYLDVEKYPTLTFRSTRIEMLSSDHGKITGDLTIHGVTREVVLDTQLTGRGKNPEGREVVAFEASTLINRKDFGLLWNVVLETGAFLVGDIIKIELAVEGVR